MVLRHSRKTRANRYLALYLGAIGYWQFGSLMVTITSMEGSAGAADLWYTMVVAGSGSYFGLYLPFIHAFLQPDRFRTLVKLSYLFSLGVILISVFSREMFITGVSTHPKTGLFIPELGPLAMPSLIPVFGMSFVALSFQITAFRHSRSAEFRNRILYLMIGYALVVIGATANMNETLRGYPIDVAANLVNAVLLTVVLVRRELVELETVAHRAFSYVVAVFFITGIYVAAILAGERYLRGVLGYTGLALSFGIGVIAVLVLYPLREWTVSLADRLFYGQRTDYYERLRHFAGALARILDLDHLARTMLEMVSRTFDVDNVHLFLWERDRETFVCWAGGGLSANPKAPSFSARGELARRLETLGAPLTALDLEIRPEMRSIPWQERAKLEELGAELMVPLLSRETLIAFLAAGPKRNLSPWYRRDIELLAAFADQAATALGNARYFEETRRLALTDPLTGLYNRRFLREVLPQEEKRLQAEGLPLALLMIDLWGYKKYNDRYGHQYGDEILKEIGRFLRDEVGEKGYAVRYGGDEFLVVLPDTDEQTGGLIRDQLDKAFVDFFDCSPWVDPEFPLAANLGLETAGGRDAQEILAAADAAMYRDKEKMAENTSRAQEQTEPPQRASLSLDTVMGLARIVDQLVPYLAGHAERVERLSVEVGLALGLQPREVKVLSHAALLHDIGLIASPTEVSNKQGPLTREEIAQIRRHPVAGEAIICCIELLRPAAPSVRHHHERYDGLREGPFPGYPDGLQGKAIPLGARIIAVVDAYDAMTADRPYRTGRSLEEAVKELERGSGRQFDPNVVGALLKILRRGSVLPR
ncbi:MAG: diguanylate cyclase [Firmicutes bacterium]|nr:diguanylate cyclase [Bacillota bacterium]